MDGTRTRLGAAQRLAAQRLADQATAHHLRGELDAAEALYREALSVDPMLPEGLHGMGLLALGRGMPAQAIALIGKASSLKPNQALFTLNLGHALRALGHVDEARAAFQVASLQDPGDPRCHAALAGALAQLGRLAEAVEPARTALKLATDPSHALGMEALLGRAAVASSDWPEAVARLKRAVGQDPADAASWHQLAVSHLARGQHADAERCFRQVVALRPDDPAALANLGARLFEANAFDEALDLLRRATILAPASAETASNLGLVLLALGHLGEAEQVLADASLRAPDQAGVAVNHGTALLELGRTAEAEQCFSQVEADRPGTIDAHRARFNRATALLGAGHFGEGWRAFESRRAVLGRGASRLPDWDGTDLPAPQNLLIEAEQGLGDVIQFLRYVPLAMQRAATVLVLPEPLVRLARHSLPSGCIVVAVGLPVPDCAVRVGLLSLPLLLGIDPPLWPGPYLRSDPEASQGAIGLCWSGSPGYRFDRRRSLKLSQLAPLAAPHRRFVALQPDRAEEPAPPGMMLERPVLRDLADTAAQIASLDLVITVDTAVAHLAGAMGRPVCLLNRFGGDWRWRDGNLAPDGTSLWYPSVRVFAQSEAAPPDRAWTPVISRVASALDATA